MENKKEREKLEKPNVRGNGGEKIGTDNGIKGVKFVLAWLILFSFHFSGQIQDQTKASS